MIDNNKLSLMLSIIAFGYNIYSRVKKIHNFNLIIGDRINNVKEDKICIVHNDNNVCSNYICL